MQECKELRSDTEKVRYINTHGRQHDDIGFLQCLVFNLMTIYEEAWSVQRLATGWTVRGSNYGGARFSAHVQTGLESHPAFCTLGTMSIPSVERSEHGVGHPPHLVLRLKKE